MMDIRTAIEKAEADLLAAGVEEPRREAALLLALSIKRDRTFIFAHPEYNLTSDEQTRYLEYVARRSGREPFHYISGIKEFYGLDFEVGPGVLIPRPETELLVDAAIAIAVEISPPRILEIGVGSGCISVAILKNVPQATAVAVDISEVALAISSRNAERHSVSDRLELLQGDVYSSVVGRFDLIVSNPPYIPETDKPALEPEVRSFEPSEALYSGADGLGVVRRIIDEAPEYLNIGGSIFIEIGLGQADIVRTYFAQDVWKPPRLIRDLQGIERIAVCSIR